MEWDDLKHFLAVARSGSLTDAARVLKASPATVGRRVSALERGLGARLFDRKPTGYALTASGEALQTKAEEVEWAALAIERAALGADLRTTETIRVASTEDMAAALIAPNLSQFRRRFPGVSLELRTQQNLVNLVRREADVALRQVRPDRGDLVIRRAGSWPLGLYAARSYAASRGLKPGKVDFSKVELITWTDDWAHLRGGPWFSEHAAGAPIALAASSRRIHQAACRAGVGVAILPCIFGDAEPELICLLPPRRVVTLDVWAVVHRDLSRSKRVRAVINFLCECVSRYCK
jgi:DNA-binding transcriptional LysR family regulator